MPGLAYRSAQRIYSALRCAKNRALNLLDAPVLVLLYHRVTELAADPELLAVTPENFHAQLRYLGERFPVVRFEDDWRGLTRPAVCITFDDGYADNALEALPVLEELGVPATFFVSTGSIGTGEEFWWNELEGILLAGRAIPPLFPAQGGFFGREWRTSDAGERQAFYQACVRQLTAAGTAERGRFLASLRDWAQCEAQGREAQRAMSVEELGRLAASPLVTVGAHTVSHTALSALDESAQRQEIVRSKRQLESWLGGEISVFSYPYGRRCHYNRRSVELCRQAGFRKSAANFPGQAHRWSDPFQIPRHLVRNWPLDEFAARLEGFWTR